MVDLFGKHLIVDLDRLRATLAEREMPALDELANRFQVSVDRLAANEWSEMKYTELFFLAAVAEAAGCTFARIEENPLWATFRKSGASQVIFHGTDLKGGVVKGDLHFAEVLLDIAVSKTSQVFDTDAEAQRVEALIRTNNVISIGGSKVNRATAVALELVQKAGGPKIVFSWPHVQRATASDVQSQNGARSVRIGTGKPHIVKSSNHAVGILAACRHPTDDGQVTTVVISGCSKHATGVIANEMHNPHFNAAIDDDCRIELEAGRPIVLLYDSFRRPQWSIVGAKRKKKSAGGRKKGSRSRGYRR